METSGKMKNKIINCMLILILVFTASAAWADGAGNTVDKVKESVLDYFRPLSGVISGVEDGLAKVKIESSVSAKKGMRFSVFREGSPFYHPVTNEIIGKSEDYIGRVEVMGTEAVDGAYTCKIVEGEVNTGDIARITSSKIKLAFFQDRKANWALSELFYRTLKESGRFEILEAYTSSYNPDHLSKLAGELGAEAVLMFSTPAGNEEKLLNVKLFWTKDAKIFTEIEDVVSRDIAEMIKPDDAFLSSTVTDSEPWGSYKLEEGRLIAMGDVDGNGEKEIVVSDGNIIKVYSLKDELQELWLIKGAKWEKHLSIDILDVNGNGIAEIFVTSMSDSGMSIDTNDSVSYSLRDRAMLRSYVVEYDPSEGYRKIAENQPYFFRAAGNTLLMQGYALKKIFVPPVYKAEWKDGQYKPVSPIQLPDGVNIYGFTYIDWRNSGQKHIVSFDDKGYLFMYDEQGNTVWKSSKTYGKFDMSFKSKTYSLANPLKEWAVRGRIIPVITERGQEIIIVNKLPLVKKVPGFGAKGAEVYSLWWDGAVMDEKLVLSEVSGTITDYWIEGNNLFLVARGSLFSFVKNATSGDFYKGSILYYYNFGKN